MPWLYQFWQAGRPHRLPNLIRALAGITEHAYSAYVPLLKAAGIEHLVRQAGCLYVYRSRDALNADANAWNIRRQIGGMETHELTADEIRQLEPALARDFTSAVDVPGFYQVAEPILLTRGLAEHLVRNGGQIERERVRGFEIRGKGPSAIYTDNGQRAADIIVVAAGAWSHHLSKQLGSPFPLDTERGYHTMIPHPGIELRRHISFPEHGWIASRMASGLRLAGRVELAGLVAPPDYSNVKLILEQGKRAFPNLNTSGANQWMGFRPSSPDWLPVISRSPIFGNVFYAFGHNHLGLTGGATAGMLVSQLIGEQPTTIDVTPYRIDRFASLNGASAHYSVHDIAAC
jgi:D-amino-acid dehydrogenase